jgi:hypothetical protein
MTQDSGSHPDTSQTATSNLVQVLGLADVNRAITRIAHEIIERNRGLDGVVIIGLQRGGVWLAERLVSTINHIEGEDKPSIPLGKLDVSLFRDDINLRPVTPVSVTDIPVDLTGSKAHCACRPRCTQPIRSAIVSTTCRDDRSRPSRVAHSA